ncbi:hypothetical protein SK803_19750 [Lentzea sp. BCCO 10_0856]|uniref:DUF2690 domain-containing protein n=1 Tax=Lentzea miocenica TaxID=3095431 RepID=A0ABU4T2R3_9PSEU|nr:hypothetical protein [Lentzea sp. BCCO 10_0856]MDX8032452.1 hypothetical protein [Lentzea sp. BCCO 10_0856]
MARTLQGGAASISVATELLATAAATAGLSIALLGGVRSVRPPHRPRLRSRPPPRAAERAATARTRTTAAAGAGRKASAKGTFILYYSSTCKTNWIETPNFAGGTPNLEMTVWDQGRGKTVRFTAKPTAGRHYGNMVERLLIS